MRVVRGCVDGTEAVPLLFVAVLICWGCLGNGGLCRELENNEYNEFLDGYSLESCMLNLTLLLVVQYFLPEGNLLLRYPSF